MFQIKLRFFFYLLLVFYTTQSRSFSAEPLLVKLDARPGAAAAEAEPVLIWNESRKEPRPLAASFMRIDLRNPKYEVVVVADDDPDGAGPAEATLMKPEKYMSKYNLLAATNCNSFSKVKNGDKRRGWPQGMGVNIIGMSVADGKIISPLHDPKDPGNENAIVFWLNKKSQAFFGRPSGKADVQQAVEKYCTALVKNGRIVPHVYMPRHPRTALGVDKQKCFLLLAVVDGRRKGYSDGATMRELAEIMVEHGCHNAINLDGGGSSVMVYRDGQSESIKTANRPSGNAHRPVAVMIGVRK